MSMYESELAEALARIDAAERAREDFAFAMDYMPPDPDGGGMFTVRYEIRISAAKTGKVLTTEGGIGLNWVREFGEALDEGYFD